MLEVSHANVALGSLLIKVLGNGIASMASKRSETEAFQ
jgi:hypothetical protein